MLGNVGFFSYIIGDEEILGEVVCVYVCVFLYKCVGVFVWGSWEDF